MDNKNFFDKKTIYAGIVVFGVLMVWQNYLNNKYRQLPQESAAVKTEDANNKKESSGSTENTVDAKNTNAATHSVDSTKADVSDASKQQETVTQSPEELISFDSKEHQFSVSNRGMGIKGYSLKSHTDRDKNPIKIGNSKDGMFALGSLNQPGTIVFDIKRISESTIEGTAEIAGAKIKRTIVYDESLNSFNNIVEIENINPDFKGVSVLNSEKSIGHIEQSIFKPVFESQEVIILHEGKEERVKSSSLKEKVDKTLTNVRLVGISSHYFTSSMVDKSDISPDLKVIAGSDVDEIVTELSYKPALTSKSQMKLQWVSYAGGKSVSVLERVDKDLKHVLDLGMFSSLGIIQMHAMRWFHSIIPNWGIAIILLTLLVRVIVLPLNISTFKSTRKMQAIQPKITAIRERYKDDPQTLNREMMSVWKENKINPFGGCLPMLLQLPVFFALYQVLGQSIELYQAPFVGWIHDLSQKDPFYVLPALMAVAMYFQQKLTPTATMDPAQAKMMQFLPLIFALMMINLPADLTLYIFINTLAGIIPQQLTNAKATT